MNSSPTSGPGEDPRDSRRRDTVDRSWYFLFRHQNGGKLVLFALLIVVIFLAYWLL